MRKKQRLIFHHIYNATAQFTKPEMAGMEKIPNKPNVCGNHARQMAERMREHSSIMRKDSFA